MDQLGVADKIERRRRVRLIYSPIHGILLIRSWRESFAWPFDDHASSHFLSSSSSFYSLLLPLLVIIITIIIIVIIVVQPLAKEITRFSSGFRSARTRPVDDNLSRRIL